MDDLSRVAYISCKCESDTVSETKLILNVSTEGETYEVLLLARTADEVAFFNRGPPISYSLA